MKEWTPQRDFKKADFPVNREKGRATQGRSDAKAVRTVPQQTTDLKPGRVVKAWVPPSVQSVSEQATRPAAARTEALSPEAKRSGPERTAASPAPRPAPPPGALPVKRAAPKLIVPESREQAKRRAAEEAATKHAAFDMSGALLDELVLSRPFETADLLRRWYWQKPSGGTAPQTKIYIVLHSMTVETLVELYRCLTAMERRQMHEIYTRKQTVVRSDILAVRNEFMQTLAQSPGTSS